MDLSITISEPVDTGTVSVGIYLLTLGLPVGTKEYLWALKGTFGYLFGNYTGVDSNPKLRELVRK